MLKPSAKKLRHPELVEGSDWLPLNVAAFSQAKKLAPFPILALSLFASVRALDSTNGHFQ